MDGSRSPADIAVRLEAADARIESDNHACAPRVTQLDANRLDHEFDALLTSELHDVVRNASPSVRAFVLGHVPQLLSIVLVGGAILRMGCTPGMAMQGLCYQAAGAASPAAAPRRPGVRAASTASPAAAAPLPKRSIALLLLFRVLLPHSWLLARRSLLMHGWALPTAAAWKQRLFQCVAAAERALSVARLLQMVQFLRTGDHATLAERCAGVRCASAEPAAPRVVNFEYLNQQLVWAELQEFIFFLLPLLSPRSLSATPLGPVLASAWRRIKSATAAAPAPGVADAAELSSSTGRPCGICARQPIPVAVASDVCGHVFCYMCVQKRWQDSLQPACATCGAELKTVHMLADVVG